MTQQLAARPAPVGPRVSRSAALRACPTSAKRLGQSAFALFLTLTTVFVLIRLAPGDPAYAMAGPLATTEDLAKIRTDMGLDQSVFVQYLRYLQGVLQLDLGTSYSFQAPAFEVVLDRLPYTITLSVAAILLTTVVSVPLGVWMARHADTRRELAANAVTIAGQSMPDFWTGLMLITLFAVLIPVFPTAGFTHVVEPGAARPSRSRSCRSR